MPLLCPQAARDRAITAAKDKLKIFFQVTGETAEEMFQQASALHDYFGRGGSDVMKRLKAMRTKIKG